MLRPGKVKAVASFEFLSQVWRVSYLISIVSVPLILLAYVGLMAFVGIITEESRPSRQVYGIVNLAQGVSFDSTTSAVDNMVFVLYPDERSAMTALAGKSIRGWFLLPADYVKEGRAVSYATEAEGISIKDSERALRTLLRSQLLRRAVAPDLAERIEEPLNVSESWVLKADGALRRQGMAGLIAQFAIPLLFAILLFMAILGTGMSLVQGTATEKENRVVDVLLSSATAEEIMAGKLLGQGGSGLLQVAAWFGMAGVGGATFATQLASHGITLLWGPLVVALLYFVAAYFFLGSLLLGTGALGGNYKEAQQWSLLWILLASLPMAFMATYIREPHSTLAKVFSWFPFSSSWVVTFRFWMDPTGISWWEVVGPFLFLIACTWVTVWLGARLLRLGLLLTGSRATLSQVIRQLRLNP